MRQLLFSLIGTGVVLTGCKSDSQATTEALQQVAKAAADSPEARRQEPPISGSTSLSMYYASMKFL
ncbi:hypothetical protein [Hymenobacter lucidus]|uniref:Uncharacterized protein n=1 Tax=Hymenobacter lucidus TaxID=2880930 RepID=A0ABS8ATL1_9BACT|nr:hypothetical protein [Hymenobacter lucidus]MCB2408933.1 hypothetical protein [Hymenobacter lucidus]